ncbi:hypothetical protein TIFTF001_022486 [Ficus carica]|uniref:Amine oxidase domain-containing protein n=1 Tax=Ficus carica TaxID=3494 RepID=A0AA88DEJ6_FICCA|nr:hypothetical protein TIFTF001_022486 [Ficus carica]
MMKLFERLGVEMETSDMSFSVSLETGKGCDYLEILESNPDIDRNETLGEFIKSHGYSQLFQKAYLIPICGSICSCPSEGVMSFSAFSVLSICRNHNLLQLFDQPQWLTIKGRSHCFVKKVREELEIRGCRIRTRCEVQTVSTGEGCVVHSEDGSKAQFNGCILAVHAPDALRLLEDQATPDERRILGAFQYVYSDVFLHRDKTLMPQNPAAWSAWNFLGSKDNKMCLTYWLNVLQNLGETSLPFLVTLNPEHPPSHTLLKWTTGHLVPSVAASKASLELHKIQGKRGIWFCGTYQGYGFHEDGFKVDTDAAYGMIGKGCDLLSNPKQMVPSLLETGARLFATRFLRHFISAGRLTILEDGGTMFSFEEARKNARIKPSSKYTVTSQADLGLADAYINGDFTFVDKDEGLLNLFLSNELFALFLDETMTYSTAVFEAEGEDLKVAQLRKISLLIEKARVEKDHEVLEIGCGWGGLAIELVKRTGCKYTGITLSEEKLKFAQKRVRDAGLENKIKFLLCDYRQLPAGYKCDRIISWRSSDFIKEYIFPGGCLPSLSRIISAMAAASRFCAEHIENIGNHSQQTLMYWRKIFLKNQRFFDKCSKILALGFDEKFIRTWEYYFDYSAAGLKSRTLGNYQPHEGGSRRRNLFGVYITRSWRLPSPKAMAGEHRQPHE